MTWPMALCSLTEVPPTRAHATVSVVLDDGTGVIDDSFEQMRADVLAGFASAETRGTVPAEVSICARSGDDRARRG
jgi:hypothetical protein